MTPIATYDSSWCVWFRRSGRGGLPREFSAGSRDPARRVRKLAAKLSVPFAGNPAVEARLREIVDDDGELTKVRSAAFMALSSGKFAARDVLRHVVETGSKQEAVDATRALCGYKVVNLGSLPAAERRRVAQTAEPAGGRVFFWVPRISA